jgi:hypothetical protein
MPAENEAPAGTSLRFLVVTAIDGSLVEAALWQPGDRPVNTTTLVIDVHGSGGTFHGPPNGFLARRWPPKAMACSASIPDSPARA